jgi:NTP pyrophosphatase (non-canonical NTP hydrolase)
MANMRVVPRSAMVLDTMIEECVTDSARWFPKSQTVDMLTLCIAGEVGEVANIVKKVVRGTLLMEDAMGTLPEEIVDILIYLCNLMGHSAFADVDWKSIWDKKRSYNEMRFGGSVRSDIRHPEESLGDIPEDISPRKDRGLERGN